MDEALKYPKGVASVWGFDHDNVRDNFFADRLGRIMAWMMGRQVDKALAKST